MPQLAVVGGWARIVFTAGSHHTALPKTPPHFLESGSHSQTEDVVADLTTTEASGGRLAIGANITIGFCVVRGFAINPSVGRLLIRRKHAYE